MKLSTALEGYWLDKQLEFSPNTFGRYRYVFSRLSEFLGDVDIEAVTTIDIRRFLAHVATQPGLRGRPVTRRTVHDVWATLSSLWTWAARELDIPHIIRGKIGAPTYTQKTIDPLTADDIRALVTATAQTRAYTLPNGKRTRNRRPTANRDKALVLVLLDSGLRVSELCALTIDDYDMARGRLHVRHGKGNKARYAVIGNRARKALWTYTTARGELKTTDPLFAVRGNTPMSRDNIYHMLARLGEEAGVPGVHPHRFRHTFAITFLRNGGNPLLLQELMGHERLETVQVYVKLAEQDIDKAGRHSPADNWGIG